MKFFLQNQYKEIEAVDCENEMEAFNLAVRRNRCNGGTCWKAYTEHGDLIYGLYQNNDSGKYKTVCIA